jgi:hypothetical protein
MIPLALGAAAILLFMMTTGAGAAKPGEGLAPALDAELKKLYAENPQAYTAINNILAQAWGEPSVMMQYAMSLQAGYPAIANELIARFNKVTAKVTGKSGTEWFVWSQGKQPDGWIPVQVLSGATPVISYRQKGDDKSSRQLTQTHLDPSKYANPSEMQLILNNAMADFV